MSKPTNKPGWNPSDSSKVVEPNSTKKAQGWAAGEKPAAEHFNWLMKTISQWIDHIDAEGVQGPKGDTGAQGPQGIQGPQGLQGPAGIDGAQGAKGDTGAKGETGPQGLQGAKGETGAQGIQGLKGDKGETGAQGAQGDKGDTGPQGLQGAKGDTGAQGIQGDKGDTGPQGLQGLKGDTGAQGIQGIQGVKGDTGPQGLQGPKGDTGAQGPQGVAGSISASDLARISALEAVSGVVAASPVTVTFPYNGGAAPGEYTIGNSGSAISVNWSNGASQFVTLTADATLAFSNGVAGNTYYLRVQQGGYGLKRMIGWPTNIIWNSGSVPTISTAAWTVDVLGFYFDGTNYYGYVSQGWFTAPSVIDTKNGYISAGVNSAAYVRTVEKINFNSDGTLSTVQTSFGYIPSSTGGLIDPTVTSSDKLGQGTQSSTYGYHTFLQYTSLPTVNGQSTAAMNKLQFSTDTSAIIAARPSNTSFFSTSGRRGLIQSSLAAYIRNITTTYGKFLFSTDTASTITVLTATAGTPYSSEIGYSGQTSGVIWQGNGSQSVLGVKTTFSTDTSNVFTVYYPLNYNYSGGWSEPVDGDYNSYTIAQTATTPASTLYKTDKSIDAWTTIGSFSVTGAGCSAVQGNTAGYFCGGQNSTGVPNTANSSLSTIRKIVYSPETFSTHSASLSNARVSSSGFEG